MDKYDRQVRLWSKDGQQRLHSSSALIIGVTLASTEALKDLVLAGLGYVMIVSSDRVTETDVTGNFFLTPGSVGKNAAKEVAVLLGELNPDVRIGTCTNISKAFKLAPEAGYSVVLCTDRAAAKLPMKLDYSSTPILEFGTMGLNGRIRLFADEICIIESHPEPAAAVDLRFVDLWPEYKKFVDSIDLDSLDDFEHAHVPFPVILSKALEIHLKENLDQSLTSRQERDLFKRTIRKMTRSTGETNFEEALKNSWRVWREPVPEGLHKLFAYYEARSSSKDTNDVFWILVGALKEFISKHGVLPVSGVIPDMTSETSQYLNVREIYTAKANADAKEIHSIASSDVPFEIVRSFCRNARFVQAIVSRSTSTNPNSDVVAYEEAIVQLFGGPLNLPSQAGRGSFYEELVATEGKEIPVVAALIGGIVAQEATKLAIAQYTPMFSVLIYKGGPQITETFEENRELINS